MLSTVANLGAHVRPHTGDLPPHRPPPAKRRRRSWIPPKLRVTADLKVEDVDGVAGLPPEPDPDVPDAPARNLEADGGAECGDHDVDAGAGLQVYAPGMGFRVYTVRV